MQPGWGIRQKIRKLRNEAQACREAPDDPRFRAVREAHIREREAEADELERNLAAHFASLGDEPPADA